MSKRSEAYLRDKSGLEPSERKTGPEAASAMLDLERAHERPLGGRDAFSRMALTLVEQAGDEIRTSLAAPEVVSDFVTAIHSGLKVRDRTCLNLYPRLLKMVDDEKKLIIEIWDSLGVKDAGEARAKIAMAQSVEGMGPHDGADRCLEYLSAYLSAYPDRRHAIVKRLGGVTEVTSADYRVVSEKEVRISDS